MPNVGDRDPFHGRGFSSGPGRPGAARGVRLIDLCFGVPGVQIDKEETIARFRKQRASRDQFGPAVGRETKHGRAAFAVGMGQRDIAWFAAADCGDSPGALVVWWRLAGYPRRSPLRRPVRPLPVGHSGRCAVSQMAAGVVRRLRLSDLRVLSAGFLLLDLAVLGAAVRSPQGDVSEPLRPVADRCRRGLAAVPRRRRPAHRDPRRGAVHDDALHVRQPLRPRRYQRAHGDAAGAMAALLSAPAATPDTGKPMARFASGLGIGGIGGDDRGVPPGRGAVPPAGPSRLRHLARRRASVQGAMAVLDQ